MTVWFVGGGICLAVAGLVVVPRNQGTHQVVAAFVLFGGAAWLTAMGLWFRHKASSAINKANDQAA
jgi:arginine exporter protein ArgO